MTIFHDEIEIEDFDYDKEEEMYYYPCPCGDRFQISKDILMYTSNVVKLFKKEQLLSFWPYLLNRAPFRAGRHFYNVIIDDLKEELLAGEEVATCPSCSLVVKVIYDLENFKAEAEEIHNEATDKETVKA